jgi:LuxR family maltose regulon positive regulatory protein
MPTADPLIRTKLHLPFTRPGLVPRPRLDARMMEGVRSPLTLITAPAGFGKTTLVTACISKCGIPAAWLSLDKNDNQEGRFLTYLIAALNSADNRVGSEAGELMAGIQPARHEAVLTSLINDLTGPGTEMILVLDDYQLLNSQAVHDQVAFLIEHQPSSFHLIIATRSDPPLPLARLRARGQTVELRSADLRFTEPEAAEFLNEVMGLQLDTRSINLLEERTEGWIAGLQMAALSMRDRKDAAGFIAGFSGTNRFILDYLMEEVLANQTPEMQRFLLQTSILERLTGPLCGEMLAGEEMPSSPATILEQLERSNLFLVPLDDERTWFRYHHLFADLLRARLQLSQPSLIPRLHMRAAGWLEQNGLIPDAVQHLVSAGEHDRAADLIEHYGSEYWAKSDLSVMHMADNLPPEMLIARPKIGLCQAWMYIIQGNIPRAMRLLPVLSQQFNHPGSGAEQRWMQTVVRLALAFLTPAKNIPESDPLPAPAALDEIPPEELVLRDAAEILYGMTLGRRGEIDQAGELAQQWIEQQKDSNRSAVIPTILAFLARVYLIQGRLSTAAALCREYIDPGQIKGRWLISTAGSMHIVLGEVLYEWNCLEEAERQIRRGLRENEPWQNIMTYGTGLSVLVRLQMTKRDFSGASETLAKFQAIMQQHSRPREFGEDFYTLTAHLQLAARDLPSVTQWANQIDLNKDLQLHPEDYQLTLAHIYLALGWYDEVEGVLSAHSPPANIRSRVGRQIEFHLLRAAALAGQKRLPEALELIQHSLALGEPEGYLRSFLDVGEPVRELLAAYLRTDAPAHKLYTQKVLAAFSASSGGTSKAPQQGSLIEPLSERELEVLHLMALGKTNQEIATQLIVAAGTIKAHAANIYRKLDVANRTEAVTRARLLGILS